MTVEEKIKELKINLPTPANPVGSYVAAKVPLCLHLSFVGKSNVCLRFTGVGKYVYIILHCLLDL